MRLTIFRLVLGMLLTALGVWMAVRIVSALLAVHAPWPDFLLLMFPVAPLAVGLMALFAAVARSPNRLQPFVHERHGAARIFGSASAGFWVVSSILIHMIRQGTAAGAIVELVAGAIVIGLLALLYGAINADLRGRKQNSGQ